VTPGEMRKASLYNDLLDRHGFRWFAVVAFWADRSPWALSIQRTPRDGPFEAGDKQTLELLSERLTLAATLSKTVGGSILRGTINVLARIGHPTVAISQSGHVIEANLLAEQMFDREIYIHNRRLRLADRRASAQLDQVIERTRLPDGDDVVP